MTGRPSTSVEVACSGCGAKVMRRPSELKRHKSAFCTYACWKAKAARERKSRYPRVGPNGEYAHRVAAAKKLGRALRPGETVHHEDENPENFDPDNLEVFPSQSEHARHHFKGRRHTPEQVRKRVEAVAITKAIRKLVGGNSRPAAP